MEIKKYRDFTLTINQGAECYDNILECINDMNIKTYGLITHNKDYWSAEEQALDPSHIEGTPKREHKHLVIQLKNAITLNSMLNHFKGAHVEKAVHINSCYQYLIHKNHPEKAQYDPKEIITNDYAFIQDVLKQTEYETFLEREMITYIAQGVTTPFRFYTRFGLGQYKTWWNAYNDFIVQSHIDKELAQAVRNVREELSLNELKATGLPFEIQETGELVNE